MWAGNVKRVGEIRYSYKILVSVPERKGLFLKRGCKWVYHKKACRYVGWNRLTQGGFVVGLLLT